MITSGVSVVGGLGVTDKFNPLQLYAMASTSIDPCPEKLVAAIASPHRREFDLPEAMDATHRRAHSGIGRSRHRCLQ
jgi:hypothetical protein